MRTFELTPHKEASMQALSQRIDVEAQRQQAEDRPAQAFAVDGEEEHDGVKGAASQEDDPKHPDAR